MGRFKSLRKCSQVFWNRTKAMILTRAQTAFSALLVSPYKQYTCNSLQSTHLCFNIMDREAFRGDALGQHTGCAAYSLKVLFSNLSQPMPFTPTADKKTTHLISRSSLWKQTPLWKHEQNRLSKFCTEPPISVMAQICYTQCPCICTNCLSAHITSCTRRWRNHNMSENQLVASVNILHAPKEQPRDFKRQCLAASQQGV